MTSQDLQKRLDITGLTTVTGSQINQSVETAYPADDKGLIISSTDTAVDTPEVPDPSEELEGVTPDYWERYIWRRVPHEDDELNGVRLYVWNPNATNDATFLKWETFNADITEALEAAEDAQEDADAALVAATTAQTAAEAAANAATEAAEDVATLDLRLSATQAVVEIIREDITEIETSLENVAQYGIGGLSTNLNVYNNTATPLSKIDIVIDKLLVSTSAGLTQLITDESLTIDSAAAVGVNGPDTDIVADKWYYIWVIYNPDSATVAGLLSQSSISPILPSGYTYKALVSCVYRSGTDFLAFLQINNRIIYDDVKVVFDAKSVVTINVFAALIGADLATFNTYVPLIAKSFQGNFGIIEAQTQSVALGLASGGPNSERKYGKQYFHFAYGDSVGQFSAAQSFDLPVWHVVGATDFSFWWSSNDIGAIHRLEVTGFTI